MARESDAAAALPQRQVPRRVQVYAEHGRHRVRDQLRLPQFNHGPAVQEGL